MTWFLTSLNARDAMIYIYLSCIGVSGGGVRVWRVHSMAHSFEN